MVIIYVLVVTEVGKENEIAKELSKIKGVTEAKTVYGEFDVVARIEAENLREIDEIITTVRKVSGIIRTVTLISA